MDVQKAIGHLTGAQKTILHELSSGPVLASRYRTIGAEYLLMNGLICLCNHPTAVERYNGIPYPAQAYEITDTGRAAI